MSSDGECPICFCNFPKSVIGVHASSCTGKKPNSSSFEKALKRPAPTSNHPFFATPAKQPKQQEEELEKTEQKKKPPALVHNTKVPLAEAMRPTSLSEFVGQEELCSQNGMWQALLQGSPARLPCLILWGPPGTGKTSLANVVAIKCKANSGEARFVKLSACTSGVADVKEVVKVAKNEWKMFKKRTVLFVDEIHRFNKTQQDAFLPHMEDGTIILMGATTENPSFSLNSALLSRCKVLTLKKLPFDAMMTILKKAANSSDEAVVVESVALEYLANIADGDARMALNNLEAVLSWAKETSKLKITVAETKIGVSRGHLRYDQKGDEHYHCASALQKSIRGSDENAAIYWTMRMFDAGEDPLFIARRFIRIAGEDVGLADPAALNLAVSTMQGCQLIGKPECNVLLAQCAIYLARAPKSHEVMMAMGKVSETLKSSHSLPPIPIHLRNANSKLDRDAGYGAGYSYNLSKVKSISYMPEGMTEVKFL